MGVTVDDHAPAEETAGDQEKEVTAELRTITAEEARSLLKNEISSQRSQRPRRIRQYRKEMEIGRWIGAASVIAISDNGKLVNGGHRLRAQLAILDKLDDEPFGEGLDVEHLVVEGVPASAFPFIDQGAPRSLRDAIVTSELMPGNSNEPRGVASLALQVMSGRTPATGGGTINPLSEQLSFVRDNLDELRKAVKATTAVWPRLRGMGVPESALRFAMYDAIQKDREQKFVAFMDDVATGVLEKPNATWATRKGIDKAVKSAVTPSPKYFAGLIIKGFNYHLSGRTSSTAIQFRRNEKFPSVRSNDGEWSDDD